jgi:hypothetical protein
MIEMRPERDFARPHGGCYELRSYNKRVAAVSVADEIGERYERSGTLTGAERRDHECAIMLVEPRGGSLLIAAQDARDEGRIHDNLSFESVALDLL